MNFTSNLAEIVFDFQLEKLDLGPMDSFTVKSEKQEYNGQVHSTTILYNSQFQVSLSAVGDYERRKSGMLPCCR